ncbi:hypothetical protein H5410_051895 [Solanum commersonii]|uniref:Uncharacterized protein n=1 Tax=Solanum commersonii TaxID=4109 RepID=A0A9J5X1T9_SOLCO|nr:hypothetical protein H5410_051895 [Solanum commersonii]
MDNAIQKLKTNEDNLKSKASQQHDYKNVELRQSKDRKNPELKGDDGKLLKTHNVCLNTAVEKIKLKKKQIEVRVASNMLGMFLNDTQGNDCATEDLMSFHGDYDDEDPKGSNVFTPTRNL